MQRSLARLALILMFAYPVVISAADIQIRGTYGGVKTFWQAGHSLADHGVNAVFVGSYGINDELIEKARAEGVKVFSEFATLNGGRYLETHPEAWPIDSSGARSPKADWFMGVCPTNPAFRAYRMSALRSLLERYPLDGIWMDYVHWHAQFESPEPILPETCFCDNCIRTFQSATGVTIPDSLTTAAQKARWILASHERSWRDWRCRVVVDWARDIKAILNEIRPGALLGLYHAPWTDSEFNGARRKILGLDFELLAPVVDVFSPMVYHGRMERSAEWVGEYVSWFCGALNLTRDSSPRVWPIVQGTDEPSPVSPAEFEQVLRLGAGSCATGVMMFTIHGISKDPAKLEVMKRVYSEWAED
jgi:hypothetical protein